MAIVMVTHDLGVAARAQRVVLLESGRIVQASAGARVRTAGKLDFGSERLLRPI
jgi:ABC-type glutathione transport system ATPase component